MPRLHILIKIDFNIFKNSEDLFCVTIKLGHIVSLLNLSWLANVISAIQAEMFVSCNPTLTSFYSKKSLLLSFFALPTPNQRKTCMHKIHIFDQKNNPKNIFLPTYLPYFILDRYRKQTISFLGLSICFNDAFQILKFRYCYLFG